MVLLNYLQQSQLWVVIYGAWIIQLRIWANASLSTSDFLIEFSGTRTFQFEVFLFSVEKIELFFFEASTRWKSFSIKVDFCRSDKSSSAFVCCCAWVCQWVYERERERGREGWIQLMWYKNAGTRVRLGELKGSGTRVKPVLDLVITDEIKSGFFFIQGFEKL